MQGTERHNVPAISAALLSMRFRVGRAGVEPQNRIGQVRTTQPHVWGVRGVGRHWDDAARSRRARAGTQWLRVVRHPCAACHRAVRAAARRSGRVGGGGDAARELRRIADRRALPGYSAPSPVPPSCRVRGSSASGRGPAGRVVVVEGCSNTV